MKCNGIELVPIKKEQILNNKEYAFWNKSDIEPIIESGGICYFDNFDNLIVISKNSNFYDFVAEIPKPQKRERTVVEKVKYLQKIESELKDDEILVGKHLDIDNWIIDVGIITHRLYENRYQFAIYKSEDDIEIIEIPEIEV